MAALVLLIVPPQRKDRIYRHQKILDGNFTDEELRQRYRFGWQSILSVSNLLRQVLTKRSMRNHALSVEQQVACSLRFFASGSFLQVVGDTTGLDKSTVSRCVRDVCAALCQFKDHVLKWPSLEERQRGKTKFFSISGFLSVIGAVDGTHIKLQAPHDDEPSYVNRKGYHSINVQAVCDADGKFLNINAGWPGCSHDAHVFRNSQVCLQLEQHQNWEYGVLLGDSGYPCRPFLLTPYINPQNAQQHRYNIAHKKTRSTIERTFGRWKRRFHVLHSEMRMKPERVVKVIVACAVLHNIAITLKEPLMDEDINHIQAADDVHVYEGPQDGRTVRDHISRTFF